jgi:hypothetical protein
MMPLATTDSICAFKSKPPLHVCRRRSLHERRLRSVLKGNLALLTKHERRVVADLLHGDHAYMFRNWPRPGVAFLSRTKRLSSCDC